MLSERIESKPGPELLSHSHVLIQVTHKIYHKPDQQATFGRNWTHFRKTRASLARRGLANRSASPDVPGCSSRTHLLLFGDDNNK